MPGSPRNVLDVCRSAETKRFVVIKSEELSLVLVFILSVRESVEMEFVKFPSLPLLLASVVSSIGFFEFSSASWRRRIFDRFIAMLPLRG